MEFFATLSDAMALFLLWLFATAGWHKTNPANAEYFAELMTNYGWSNKLLVGVVTKIMGGIEIGIGIAIVLPASRSLSILLAISLLIVYMLNMAYQIFQGRQDLDCGCGGSVTQLKMSGHLLFRNIVLIGLALLCLASGNSYQINFWLLSGLVAMVGIIVYQSCEQLIGNAQKLKTLRTY